MRGMSAEDVGLRWGVERRLAFVDACLFWAARVNRSDLVREFGISVPQASADLSRYFEMAPGNAVYDRTRKTYVRGPDFMPVIGTPSADEVLEGLVESELRVAKSARPPWGADVVAEHALPRMKRTMDAGVLQGLLSAVREKQMVKVRYQSVSRPRPTTRWISPHTFANDGDRWHVRAYCAEHRDFRDFVVSRITQVADPQQTPVEASADRGWDRFVTLKVAANPVLGSEVQRALEAEYAMSKRILNVRVRVCLAYYVERRLALDVDDSALPTGRKQLVLVNTEEVRRAEEDAIAETKMALSRFAVV
jgi:hypothetical protein